MWSSCAALHWLPPLRRSAVWRNCFSNSSKALSRRTFCSSISATSFFHNNATPKRTAERFCSHRNGFKSGVASRTDAALRNGVISKRDEHSVVSAMIRRSHHSNTESVARLSVMIKESSNKTNPFALSLSTTNDHSPRMSGTSHVAGDHHHHCLWQVCAQTVRLHDQCRATLRRSQVGVRKQH